MEHVIEYFNVISLSYLLCYTIDTTPISRLGVCLSLIMTLNSIVHIIRETHVR